MSSKYELVFCVVNNGYSETVMASARAAGAKGGTVITATGTANPKAESFFGVTIVPNKEIVLILVDKEIKEAVLHNLYRDVGLKTAGQGIAFTLPVNDVVGLTPAQPSQPSAETEHAADNAEHNAEQPAPSDSKSE